VPTFLVDGAVAGTWRYGDGRVHLSPYERLDRAALRELREEANRLAAFHE
jgi:winged helix DNA-binding protein